MSPMRQTDYFKKLTSLNNFNVLLLYVGERSLEQHPEICDHNIPDNCKTLGRSREITGEGSTESFPRDTLRKNISNRTTKNHPSLVNYQTKYIKILHNSHGKTSAPHASLYDHCLKNNSNNEYNKLKLELKSVLALSL